VNPVTPDSEDRLRLSDHADDGLELAAYFRQIWSYRVVIAVVALVCAGSAAAVALTSGPKYQARATVMVSQAKIGDFVAATVPIATLRPLLESKNVAAKVIQALRLDQPPRRVSASTFFSDVATVEQVRDSPMLTLTVELDDPALAASAANLIAEQAVALSRAVSEGEGVRARNDLDQQKEDAKARMEQAVEALRKFQEASQIELVRKDVESMLVQRGELLPLLIRIETEKAKLAAAEKELAVRDRIGTVKRTIDSDPVLMESARKPADSNGSRLIGLETKNEFVNPVYESLDSQIATIRTTLAELERKRIQIVDIRKLDAPQTALLTKVYALEGELTRLTVERDLVTAVYRQVATAYETARTQVAARSAQLQIIDKAVASDQPVSRHVARNAAAGLTVGLVFASLGALLWSMMRQAVSIT